MPYCRGFVSAASGAAWPMAPCSAPGSIIVHWKNARAGCTDVHWYCTAHQLTAGGRTSRGVAAPSGGAGAGTDTTTPAEPCGHGAGGSHAARHAAGVHEYGEVGQCDSGELAVTGAHMCAPCIEERCHGRQNDDPKSA